MVTNYDFYWCPNCKKTRHFETSKPFSKNCPVCGGVMKFDHNSNCTDGKTLLDRLPQKIECPYCHSTNTSKISGAGRIVSAGLFGLGSKKVGKQWHCNRCNSDF